jgi:hypothetical protein
MYGWGGQNLTNSVEYTPIVGMEFDGLISHNLPNTINELRTVKSDCIDLKKDLVNQIIHDGEYNFPNLERISYTKLVIDKLITFLNN